MYNINNRLISSKNELYEYVNPESIYSYYLGAELAPELWITSPFRPYEKDKSFRISYYNNQWLWTDFGRNIIPYDAIELIRELYNLNYAQALNKIYTDIYLQNADAILPTVTYESRETRASCTLRSLTGFEYDYFKPASIDATDLKLFRIYGGTIRNNGIVVHNSTELDPYFIYMFDVGLEIYKGYRPYASVQKLKFYSHNVDNHIQGYDLLPRNGNILIITKSYKDVIVWYKLGYPAIAPHTESCFVNPEVLTELKSRFKYIYVNYDNDVTGVNNSIRFTNENNLLYFNLPKSTDTKDPFEFVTKLDYIKLNTLFINKLKRDAIID